MNIQILTAINQKSFVSPIEILDTTFSTSTGASLFLRGGITIFSTTDSTNFDFGGSFLTFGGIAVSKSTLIGGVTSILNTSLSNNTSTGALIVSGGGGFNGDVYAKNIYSNGSPLKNLWGTEYSYTELLASAGSTSNSFSQRISLTSGTLLGGTYHLNIGFWFEKNSNTGNQSQFQVLLDSTALSTGTLLHEYIDRLSISNMVFPRFDTKTLALTSGIHTFSLLFRNQNNGSATNISNSRFELFRIY